MKKRACFFLILILSSISFFACNKPGPKPFDQTIVRKSIETQNAKWQEAMKENDISTIVALYTDDATMMPPNTPILKGTREIRSYLERTPARRIKVTKAALTTIDVGGKDSTVFEIGEYIINIQPEDAPPRADTGKYTTIWKLQPDGSWKMYADCWNSNKPLRVMQNRN